MGPAIALLVAAGCGGEQVLGSVEGAAAPVCDARFSQRIRIRVDARPYQQPLVDFPILLTLTGDNFDFDAAGANGEGIQLTGSDCQVLPHEIDGWDPSLAGRVWVNIPQLEPGRINEFFLFSGETAPEDRSSPNEVFNPDYAAVYHFQDDELRDASVFRQRGSNRSSTLTNGFLGNGRLFPGGASVAISDASFSSGKEGRTACMWARSDNDGAAFFWMFGYGTSAQIQGAFAMNRHATDLECMGSNGSRLTLGGVFPAGDRSWRYICCSYDGESGTIWADGTALRVEPMDWPVTLSTGMIGSSVNPTMAGANASWEGGLDEVRISRVARSAEWIAAEYESMTGNMVSLGPIDIL